MSRCINRKQGDRGRVLRSPARIGDRVPTQTGVGDRATVSTRARVQGSTGAAGVPSDSDPITKGRRFRVVGGVGASAATDLVARTSRTSRAQEEAMRPARRKTGGRAKSAHSGNAPA